MANPRRVILGDRPPYGHITAAELRTAVDTALASDSYRQRATHIGDSFRAAGSYQTAADIIVTQLSS